MKSLFISGTDTDVGKTFIVAGLAVTLRKMNLDVGVMKPFAAGIPQKTGFKSEDVEIISRAAQVKDSEDSLNPQFFPILASPYTAFKNLKTKPKINLILNKFQKLSKLHSIMLVEGMGGIMTPILQNYFVANLIKDMHLHALIITRNKIGCINHTIMTCQMCEIFKIPVKGIIINNFDVNGYSKKELKRDLENLISVRVLGSIPYMDDLSDQSLYSTFKKNVDFKLLLK
jgi:dethiobiotin synthetase